MIYFNFINLYTNKIFFCNNNNSILHTAILIFPSRVSFVIFDFPPFFRLKNILLEKERNTKLEKFGIRNANQMKNMNTYLDF